MSTLKEKLWYVANYDESGEFIQHWPDQNGNFDPVAYYTEVCDTLGAGDNPTVPGGAWVGKLSDLMHVRLKQERKIQHLVGTEEVLDRLERILKDKYPDGGIPR